MACSCDFRHFFPHWSPYSSLGYFLTWEESSLEQLQQYNFALLIILNVIKVPFENTQFLQDKMGKIQGLKNFHMVSFRLDVH